MQQTKESEEFLKRPIPQMPDYGTPIADTRKEEVAKQKPPRLPASIKIKSISIYA